MSDETAQKLRDAEAAISMRQAEAEVAKRECLAAVARGIPPHVDDLAKRVAHGQPDIARQLGVAGITALRSELAEAASVIASEVEAAAEEIKWPRRQSEYSPVKSNDIHSALFGFLYGPRVNRLAAIMKRHGFAVHDDNAQRSQGLVHPQDLYNWDDFASVSDALNMLAEAKKVVAEAKAADDRGAIESLWEDE